VGPRLPATLVAGLVGGLALVAGKTMDAYHRWMEVAIGPTMAALPAVAFRRGSAQPV
jgi:hypothetical protein